MPIPELEKFRQKYPEYNDIDDIDIANKLATKYPDAYGDLPGRVSQENSQQQPTQEQPQETIPQMLGRNLQEAARTTYREGISPVLSGISTAAFGLPKAIIPESYRKAIFPEQETLSGKALRGVSEIAGFMGGGAIKTGAKLAKRIVGDTLRKKMLRGTIQYGTAGALQTPEKAEIPIIAPKERITQGITAGVLGGISEGLVSSVKTGIKWLKPKHQLELADETRNSLGKLKNQLVEKYKDVYNKVIKQGTGKVSLQEPLLNLIDESDDIVNTIKGQAEISEALARGEPNAKRVLNIVNTFMKDPGKMQNLSLQEADGLQKYIKNLPGIHAKLTSQYKGGQVDFTNADRVLLGFANDIKAQVMNLAPEMNLVNKEYGQFMSNYKQIRPYLKWDKAVSNFKNIHKLDPAILDKLQQILPKDVLGKVLQMNRVNRNAELLKRIAPYAVAGTGGYVLREVIKK